MGRGGLSYVVAAAWVGLLWANGVAQAQGEITGRVLDAQGQPLKGVEVTLLHSGDKNPRQQVSDGEGNFRFGDLASGVYSVMAELAGYSQVICPGFRLIADLSRAFEIQMMPAEEGKQTSSCKVAEPASGGP